MPRKIAEAYILRLLKEHRLGALYSDIRADSRFDQTSIDYNFPRPAFLLIEMFAWTTASNELREYYYERVPLARQELMVEVLRESAPREVLDRYLEGMRVWKDGDLEPLENWLTGHMCAMDDEWLGPYCRSHPDVFLDLTA